jgi:hypothetical protein
LDEGHETLEDEFTMSTPYTYSRMSE